MRSDFNASSDARLVYREGPYPWIGLPLAILGLAAMYGTGTQLISSWPENGVALLGGLFLSVLILVAGVRCFVCRKVMLDNEMRQIIKTSGLLFWPPRTTHTEPFLPFTSVTWRPTSSLSATNYVVQLTAPERRIELFELRHLDDARKVVHEIGMFLELKQEHWDEAFLQQEQQAAESRRSDAMTRLLWLVFGRHPRRLVFRSESRLVFAQGFEKFLRVFGCLSGLLGLLFLFSPWLGIEVEAMKGSPLGQIVVGAIFVVVAVIFLFGRRGATVDKECGFASTWWKLLVPFRVTHRELSEFSEVSLKRVVEDSGGRPYALSRVSLVGRSVPELILFKSIDAVEVRNLAEEIASFLNFPLADATSKETLEPSISELTS